MIRYTIDYTATVTLSVDVLAANARDALALAAEHGPALPPAQQPDPAALPAPFRGEPLSIDQTPWRPGVVGQAPAGVQPTFDLWTDALIDPVRD